jgi:NUC173 domain
MKYTHDDEANMINSELDYEDRDDFDFMIHKLISQGKNLGNNEPRVLRLVTVASALMEVHQKQSSASENFKAMNPAEWYASTVSALQGENLDLASQVALLELLTMILPHVASSTLVATFPITSRTIRAIVTSCRMSEMNNSNSQNDSIATGILSALKLCCRVACLLLQNIKSSTIQSIDVQKFLQGTMMVLWEDKDTRISKAAQKISTELLQSIGDGTENSCCQFLVNIWTEFSIKHLSFPNTLTQVPKSMIDILRWLTNTIFYLNVEKLSTKVMELFMMTLQPKEDDSQLFVARVQGSALQQQRALLANLTLNLLIFMLEDRDYENQAWIDQFASRVVASLLQCKPRIMFGSGSTMEQDVIILYGKTLMVGCERCDPTINRKLLPLSLQMIVQFSKPDPASNSIAIAEGVLPELTKFIRTHLMEEESGILNDCFQDLVLALEVVLQPIYKPTWSVSLLPLAMILQVKPDEKSCHEIVSVLVRRYEEESLASLKQAIEEAVATIIQGVGLERFWKWISWKDDAKKVKKDQVISPHKTWILRILKSSAATASTMPPRLEFFQSTILPLARQCDALQTNFGKERVLDLWSLLLCFCVQTPSDFVDAFPSLAQILVRAMSDERYPQLAITLSGSLKTLAQTIQGTSNEEVFSRLSTNLLPALFKFVENMKGTLPAKTISDKNDESMDIDKEYKSEEGGSIPESQRLQSVVSAIAELARVAPSDYVQNLLKKVIQRLLTATQSLEDESERIITLLSLSQSLVSSQSLTEESITLLYRAIKPFVRSDDHIPRVQKRAYKVLLELCQKHPKFVTEPQRLTELTDLLVSSLMTCQVSARHLRLKCMSKITEAFSPCNKQQMDIIPKAIGEILLCLKDSNGKAREASYQLMLTMASKMDDMTNFFNIIAGALGAQTPHMRSAAVMAMSRLVFEYARIDQAVQSLLPMMLQTILVLFQENSREVIKSAVGFVRVSVAAMPSDQLEPLLPEVIKALLTYHKGKERFRDKIKIILKKLVRSFGYEKLMPLVPDTDARLLSHMRKLDERSKRRKASQRLDGESEKNDFEEMMESDEEDSDDGQTFVTGATGLSKFTEMTGRTGRSKHTIALQRRDNLRSKADMSTVASSKSKIGGPRLKNDTDGEVLDMLDPAMAKRVHFAVPDDDSSDDSDVGEMEFDEMGRLIISDDAGKHAIQTKEEEESDIQGAKRLKLSKYESAKVQREKEISKKMHAKSKKINELGAAYKSNKAGGDVRKKGQKFEPYAFVPLDGKSYTKKNRRKTVESMATVVRGKGKRKRT